MRARLLEATVDCLVERGWSGATTTGDRRAGRGPSRGAQLHHYPTRAALVLAAVTHLAELRANELRAPEALSLTEDRGERLGRVVDMLAALFTAVRCSWPLWSCGWPPAPIPDLRDALVPPRGEGRHARCTG